MRQLLLAVIAAGTLFATTTARADGWYFSEGFGQTEIGDEMASKFSGSNFTARIALGRQVGPWAIDAYVQVMSMDGRGSYAGGDYTAATVGVDARYFVKLAGPLQVYLRGGLNKMSLHEHSGYISNREAAFDPRGGDYAGRGITYGAGIRLSGKVRALGLLYWPLFFLPYGPKVNASLWLDTSNQFVRLHNPHARSLDGRLSTWTFGFSIGGGF